MPLYEYECDNCGNRFERIQKFSDPPADTCPKCGRGPVHKLMSSPAFQFKGSGWYVTDYARKDQGANKSEKSDSSTKAESSSETKTDSKTTAPAGTDTSASTSGAKKNE